MSNAFGSIDFADRETAKSFVSMGLSSVEPERGRWTDGSMATIYLTVPHSAAGVILEIEASAFVRPNILPVQTVNIRANCVNVATWHVHDPLLRTRAVFIKESIVKIDNCMAVQLHIPTCAVPAVLGINDDERHLGICLRRITWRTVDEEPAPGCWTWQLGRPVGGEARKSFDRRVKSGFWERFITGPNVLDMGFRGYANVGGVVPITDTAIGVDLDYPGYDGRTLPFANESQDAVYSSHCLEHITDPVNAIREWHRVTKAGGHIITTVPHAHLYERSAQLPSRWNRDHKRFYTPGSLLAEFEEALEPNTYRVRHLEDNDASYDYRSDPEKHPAGCYEITLVVEKIAPPAWRLRAHS